LGFVPGRWWRLLTVDGCPGGISGARSTAADSLLRRYSLLKLVDG
jgi:hypothetical protein